MFNRTTSSYFTALVMYRPTASPLDDSFRSCGVQGFNIKQLESASAEKAINLLENGASSAASPIESARNSGSPLDYLIETKLEQWLVDHWDEIDFGRELRIYRENDEEVGQQYDTREVGIIDLLCEDEDSGELVVIELKKGRSSDQVVGQLARYMGWVRKNLAVQRDVRGIILAPDFDTRIRYAANAIPNTQLLRYQTRFEIFQEPNI